MRLNIQTSQLITCLFSSQFYSILVLKFETSILLAVDVSERMWVRCKQCWVYTFSQGCLTANANNSNKSERAETRGDLAKRTPLKVFERFHLNIT